MRSRRRRLGARSQRGSTGRELWLRESQWGINPTICPWAGAGREPPSQHELVVCARVLCGAKSQRSAGTSAWEKPQNKARRDKEKCNAKKTLENFSLFFPYSSRTFRVRAETKFKVHLKKELGEVFKVPGFPWV